jgi:phosphoribosyl 1,2-cyclic phosphate phosphodiesterase
VNCPEITVTFLGTGTSAGVPMIACTCEVCTSSNKKDNRLRSSILVQSANTSFVIDTTPDFRYQMLRTNTRKLDAVLYTHPHKDHIAGLDDVRAYNFFYEKPMQIFSNALTEEALKKEFAYAFADLRLPGLPVLQLNTITNEPFAIGEIPIVPIEVWHLKMPVLGFRIGNFTYITDANKIEAAELEKIKGSEILVLNALRKEPHASHFTLDQAVQIAQKVNAQQTYFTHISHQLGLHKDVCNALPNGIALAYDGLKVTI